MLLLLVVGSAVGFRHWREPAGCQVVLGIVTSSGAFLFFCRFGIRQMPSAVVAFCCHLLVKIMNCDRMRYPYRLKPCDLLFFFF